MTRTKMQTDGVTPAPAAPLPVIVSDGETRTALACVRALGRSGHRVHVLSSRPSCLAGVSRFSDATHLVPDPEIDPGGWADAVRCLARTVHGALLLPVTEVAMGSAFDAGLDQVIPLVSPPREAYAVAVDKHALLERAARCGLDVPRTTLVESPAELRALPDGHAYPAILKARVSRSLVGGRWRRGRVLRVRGEAELRDAVRTGGFESGLLVQEFVPGHGEGIFLLADRGVTHVRFAHRRLREKPPGGGVSVLSESIAPDATLLEGSERLMTSLGWHGVAMVEFRRAPDGRAVVMEVNPRFWGSLQLAIDSDVDFPTLAVALARGESIPQVGGRAGVRTRWLMGDLDHLWIAWRRPHERATNAPSMPRMIAAFLRSFVDGTHDEVFRWEDPRPFLYELCERLA